MPLSPDTCGGDEEDGSCTSTKEIIPGEQRNLGKSLGEEGAESDGVGGKNGAQSGGEYSGKGEDECNEVATPERPIERVVDII